MNLRLAFGLVGLLLLVTSCSGSDASPSPSRSAIARPSPSSTQDRADLVAALRRTQSVPHHFAIDADLPESQRLEGSGAFDAANEVYTSKTALSDPKSPSSLERIVIGTDYYQRKSDDEPWVHLDLTRLGKDSPLSFETTDATGLDRFAEAITSTRRTGRNTYTGRFAPDSGGDPFLPIGAPSLRSVGMRVSPFTVTTDATGWVTAIRMEMTPSDSPTLTMEARLSAHGAPLGVEKPDAREADDLYYE